jgi:hypothetical protein
VGKFSEGARLQGRRKGKGQKENKEWEKIKDTNLACNNKKIRVKRRKKFKINLYN